jgi:hypothetical protein
MNNTLNLSIGMLTFNSPKTLKNTLESYKYTKLLELSDDICCIIQPSPKQNEEIQICDYYGVKPVLQTSNTKMAGAIKTIWNICKYDYMMFLECDFVICENENKIKNILNFGLTELKNNKVDLVRLRSLKNPGHPIASNLMKDRHKNTNWHNDGDLLRQANYITNYADEPEKIYPQYITKYSKNYLSYLMSSKHCVYTNNPYITSKKFYLDYIFSHIIDGNNLEDKIDMVWHHHDHKILITEGIFKHNRIDGHKGCDCCPKEYGGNGRCDSFKCCSNGVIEGVELFNPNSIINTIS